MPKITKTNEIESDNHIQLPTRRRNGKHLLPWLIVLLVIIAASAFAFQEHRKGQMLQKQLSDLKQNPQKANEEETKALLDKVGQLIELPDEQPTVATVSDLAPLKDQPFFAHAQIGDKVLIYSQAAKAVLYRPSTNKVIEVAPVNLNNTPAEVNTKPTTKSDQSTSSSTTTTNTKTTPTTKTAK